MGRDDWRKKITLESSAELHNAIGKEEDEKGEEDEKIVGEEENDDDEDDLEDVQEGWDELEKLERQVDECIAADGQQQLVKGGARKSPAAREKEDVVVIGDDSEEEGTVILREEWEEVSVAALPAGAHVRKPTKSERKLAMHMHRANLLCLLARGCFLSKQCDSTPVRRCWLKIDPARKLAVPLPHLIRCVHMRAILDWIHARFEVVEPQKQTSTVKMSLSKLIEAGKGSPLDKVLILVSLLRYLGLKTRLVGAMKGVLIFPCHTLVA